MKKLLVIVVLGLLWCNVAYSADPSKKTLIKASKNCSHIDYQKSKDEFMQCLKLNYQKQNKEDLFNKSKNFIMSLLEESPNKVEASKTAEPFINLNDARDFECLNLCKDSIKGMTIGELNSFCMMRCSLN